MSKIATKVANYLATDTAIKQVEKTTLHVVEVRSKRKVLEQQGKIN